MGEEEGQAFSTVIKPPPRMLTSLTTAPELESSLCSAFLLPANTLLEGKQVMAKILEFLLCKWETRIEFWIPGFGLA